MLPTSDLKRKLETLQSHHQQILSQLNTQEISSEEEPFDFSSLENSIKNIRKEFELLQPSKANPKEKSPESKAKVYLRQTLKLLEEKYSLKKLEAEGRQIKQELDSLHQQIFSQFSCEEKAAEQAISETNELKAKEHFNKAILWVDQFPEVLEKKLNPLEKKFSLQLELGSLLVKNLGYPHPEVQQAFSQAEELAWKIGESAKICHTFRGLWVYYLVHGEISLSIKIGQHLLALVEKRNDIVMIIEANMALGLSLCYMGEWNTTYIYLKKCITLYEQEESKVENEYKMENPKLLSCAFLAIGYSYQGHFTQAIQYAKDALEIAEKIKQPYNLALAFLHLGIPYMMSQDYEQALIYLEKSAEICTQHQFTHWYPMTQGFMGNIYVEMKQELIEKGIQKIQEPVQYMERADAPLARPWMLSFLANAYRKLNDFEQALSTINLAIEIAHQYDQRIYKAELYRLKGEILFDSAKGSSQEIEQCFRESIKIAQYQEVKTYELRAVLGYYRFKQSQNDLQEVQIYLQKLCGWFPPEVETKDLQEARSLLKSTLPL